MTRLRPFGATARLARLRPFGAAARQARQILMTAALVVIGGSGRVFACPVCFGAEETALIDGAKLGILVMLGITFAVQGAFLGFFLYLRKRARHIADVELDSEWSKLQRTPRAS